MYFFLFSYQHILLGASSVEERKQSLLSTGSRYMHGYNFSGGQMYIYFLIYNSCVYDLKCALFLME